MGNMYNGMPRPQSVATEQRDGLMSKDDKRSLNIMVKQIEVLGKLINKLSLGKIVISKEFQTPFGNGEMHNNVVTLNISATFGEDTYILDEEYRPSSLMMFPVCAIKEGTPIITNLSITSSGVIVCGEKNVIVNTSVSYVK